jgi:hypothetical protein
MQFVVHGKPCNSCITAISLSLRAAVVTVRIVRRLRLCRPVTMLAGKDAGFITYNAMPNALSPAQLVLLNGGLYAWCLVRHRRHRFIKPILALPRSARLKLSDLLVL